MVIWWFSILLDCLVRFATFVGGWAKWFAGNVQRYSSTLWKTSMAGLAFSYRTSYNSFLDPFLPRVMDITPTILLYSILFAITNGTFEEILWRGTYVMVFQTHGCGVIGIHRSGLVTGISLHR